MTYGYIRVSTHEQNEARQLAALSAFDIPEKNLFMDKQSGKDFNRPAYQRMIKKLKPGDLLIIKSIDRLGRNYEEILKQWRIITKEKQADIRVLDMPLLDTSIHRDLTGTLIADIVLQLLSYVAQCERENIRQRQKEGIAAAKARGVVFGAEKKKMPDDFDEWYYRWRRKEITSRDMAAHCGVHISTVYSRVRERGLPYQSMTGKPSHYANKRTEAEKTPS